MKVVLYWRNCKPYSHDLSKYKLLILFYNTLYDEMRSCHMAPGKAYAMNVKVATND